MQTEWIAEPGKQEIVLTRVFDAPRELLFKVYTDPSTVPHWWGPSYLTTTVDKMEVRQGGVWRFVQRDPAGHEHAFHGVYHAVLAPERIVNTFEYEGTPGHVLLATVTFEELPGGKTRVTDRSVFQTLADRDAMVREGAKGGAVELMERLATLVASMQG